MEERRLKVEEKFDGDDTVALNETVRVCVCVCGSCTYETCDVSCFDSRQMGDVLLIIGQMCVCVCGLVYPFAVDLFFLFFISNNRDHSLRRSTPQNHTDTHASRTHAEIITPQR